MRLHRKAAVVRLVAISIRSSSHWDGQPIRELLTIVLGFAQVWVVTGLLSDCGGAR